VSIEAINWALNDAPNVPPHLVSTLFGLANHAHADGRNAYISVPTLAKYTRKSDRGAQKCLRELLELGLIELGDQRIVEHYRADKRPTVYNLCMRGVNHSSSRDSSGVNCGTERGEPQFASGVNHSSPKPHREPKEEPHNSPAPSSLARSSLTPQSPSAQPRGRHLDQSSTLDDIEASLGHVDSTEAGLAQAMFEQGSHPRFIYNTISKQRQAAS
jgi:hypothetical protein